jgi:hypothetical protein
VSTDAPQPPGGLHPWVATAPPPSLTVTGHTATISNVRFVWLMHCSRCRKSVHLWSDDGTIDAGIRLAAAGQRRRPRTPAARWYLIFKPARTPSIPNNRPHPGCHRPTGRTVIGRTVPTGWLLGAWQLTVGPFTVAATTPQRCPWPTANAYRLVNEIWSTLRRTHPDLAAAADRHATGPS